MNKDKLWAYVQLTRFDKPVGIELLLYPTLWALLLVSFAQSHQLPNIQYLVIFTLGSVFMRAAGCVINDFADRNFDGEVERTKNRPIARGAIKPKEALLVFFFLVLLSASLLLFLPIKVFYWSFGAIFLATLYPFMKRVTYLPQMVLGMAFSWSIPMVYVAVLGHTNLFCWLLYFANLLWTVAYDTQYAITDRKDDLKIGVKSTAILFGKYDVCIITGLQLLFIGLMAIIMHHYFGNNGLGLMVLPVLLFIKQYLLLKKGNDDNGFIAFKQNVWVGRVVLVSIFVVVLLNAK